MKNIIKKRLELFVNKYEFEITVSMPFFSSAIFSVLFYLLKTYAFVNPNFIVETILNTGFSICYLFSCLFAPGVILFLISGFICRIDLLMSERKRAEEI